MFKALFYGEILYSVQIPPGPLPYRTRLFTGKRDGHLLFDFNLNEAGWLRTQLSFELVYIILTLYYDRKYFVGQSDVTFGGIK